MKNTAALPPRAGLGVCAKCRGRLTITFLRQVGTDDSGNAIYLCRNQAACRKRERQLQARVTSQTRST